MALTEAGEHFYEQCVTVVEGAQAAYESIADLRKEPVGTVRVSCPVVLAQSYLAPILPEYMASHPKVTVFIEATDRPVNLIEERFDLALRALSQIEETAGLVAKDLGAARRILVASPAFLDRNRRPDTPSDLSDFDTMGWIADMHEEYARWDLANPAADTQQVQLKPRLISGDLRVQLEAAKHGIGIALLPEPIVSTALHAKLLEHVLPNWSAPEHIIHLVYPPPRGMLPSVRSLIDYLTIHLRAGASWK
jgi:DNA-binding transcriptional LysR family regulator